MLCVLVCVVFSLGNLLFTYTPLAVNIRTGDGALVLIKRSDKTKNDGRLAISLRLFPDRPPRSALPPVIVMLLLPTKMAPARIGTWDFVRTARPMLCSS